MILKHNGQILIDPYPVNSKTQEYLCKLWKFPSHEEVQQAREKLYTIDKSWALTK